MNMCSYIAMHREKVLFGGIVNEAWVCSRDILFLLDTEIFYLRVIQIHLSSYKQALKINIFFNVT